MSSRVSVIINTLSVIVLVAAVAAAGYFYYQYRHAVTQRPDARVAAEVEATMKAVGNIMELPKGETPTLATVTDVEKLRQQDFFKRAQNGDKVLIYQKALKAILYRPSTNKIVDVGPIKLQDQGNVAGTNTTANPSPQAVKKAVNTAVTVALYNGSLSPGVTASVEAQLKQTFPDVKIVTRQQAARQDYVETTVADLTGDNGTISEDLAAFLGGNVRAKPSQEATPSADILILIGNKK